MLLRPEQALVWLRTCLRALRRLKGVRGVQVVAAFKILTSDPQVKALLVNIFGAALPLLQTWTRPRNTQNYSVHGALMRSSPYQQVVGRSCLSSKVMIQAESGKVACQHSLLMPGACGCAGGIMKCDVIAAGIVAAAKEVRPCSS